MQAKEWVDLLVPRGGPNLIAAIEADATVPYVIDGAGNCHVYVDAAANLEMAADIVVNSKTSPARSLQRRGEAAGPSIGRGRLPAQGEQAVARRRR